MSENSLPPEQRVLPLHYIISPTTNSPIWETISLTREPTDYQSCWAKLFRMHGVFCESTIVEDRQYISAVIIFRDAGYKEDHFIIPVPIIKQMWLTLNV